MSAAPCNNLAVDEGDRVTAGQLIARIDPSDAQSTRAQSQSDYDSALSKVAQAQQNLALQRLQYPSQVQSAQQSLEASRLKLKQAEEQAKIQPKLTEMAIAQAKSNLASAESAYTQTKNALVPQTIASAQSALNQAKATLHYATRMCSDNIIIRQRLRRAECSLTLGTKSCGSKSTVR